MKCRPAWADPMRGAAIVLLASMLATSLAGCVGQESGTGTGTHASTSTTGTRPLGNATAPANATVPTSATLHLMQAPGLNASAPRGNDTVAMPLAPLYPSQGIAFNTTLRGAGNLTAASTSLWVRVTQSNVQAGSGTDPGCSVALTVTVQHNGTPSSYAGGCGSLGIGVITPGDHQVLFASAPGALPGVVVAPGDGIALTFSVYVSGPGLGASAYVLAGSQERDSYVRLAGLAEPLA